MTSHTPQTESPDQRPAGGAMADLDASQEPSKMLDCSITMLTHYLPPYIARVMFHVTQEVRDFQILLSIEQEPNRQFGDTWAGLNVSVQKSWMIRRPWKHSHGFTDELYIHLPYDTFTQLWRRGPDIVFSFELGFRSLVSALYCKLRRRKLAVCVCVSEHTEQGRGFARLLLRKALLKMADAVTYNGPSCKRYLEQFHVPEKKLHHLPYCTSDLFPYAGETERQPDAAHRLICIGQLTERKGVLPLIESLTHYCQERSEQVVEIDFVGKGNLEEQIRGLTLPENLRLRLLGHMQYDQMSKAMENAGVLVFPTMADEWGLVVNEAMQTGLPVIGSQYAQASTTLIEDGKNGWIYKPDQPAELHAKLDAMFALSAEDLNHMRHHAQATVADITSTNVAKKAVAMFRSLSE